MDNKIKKFDDVSFDSIALSKHMVVISAGSEWYRIVGIGQNPLEPTGKASRFAKEPPQYSPEVYREAWKNGFSSLVGTSSTCFCQTVETARVEVGGDMLGKQIFKIKVLSDFEVVNVDSICKAENVAEPYINDDRTEFWHKFYGKKVKGLRFRSSKKYSDFNIVIFQDWFSDFDKFVDVSIFQG